MYASLGLAGATRAESGRAGMPADQIRVAPQPRLIYIHIAKFAIASAGGTDRLHSEPTHRAVSSQTRARAC